MTKTKECMWDARAILFSHKISDPRKVIYNLKPNSRLSSGSVNGPTS